MNKYKNKKVIVDDYIFDSIQESKRYKELKLLLRAGQIQDLELQPHIFLSIAFTNLIFSNSVNLGAV